MDINLAEKIIPDIDDWRLKDIKSLELLTKEQIIQLYNDVIKKTEMSEEIKVFITALYYMQYGTFIEDKDSKMSYVLMDTATNEFFDGANTTRDVYESAMYETREAAEREMSKFDFSEDWEVYEIQLGIKYMKKVVKA